MEDGLASEGLVCPNCGVYVNVAETSHDSEIIDVEARPVGQGGGLDDEHGGYAVQPMGDPRAEGWAGARPRIFRFEERQVGGGGCCNCGCFLIVLFLLLAAQGFFSLFS